jgi:hypothetical protein
VCEWPCDLIDDQPLPQHFGRRDKFAILARDGEDSRCNRGHAGIGQGAFQIGGVGVAYKVGNNARDGLCVVAGDADEIGEERLLRAWCQEATSFIKFLDLRAPRIL